jgi:NADH dehydrogenase
LARITVVAVTKAWEEDELATSNESRSELPHVVVVGGGFGGLYAARGLARARVRVTLIDKHNYHLFRPMTYQVATGLLSGDEIAPPLRSIFSKQPNIEVLMDEVSGVDTSNKLIRLQHRELHYDFLILATGIHYNYFGHDDWEQVAPGLDSIEDADRIRGKVLSAFEAAENIAAAGDASSDSIRALLTFVIVGAGTAGVEMAGTLAEMSRMSLAHDFRHIDTRSTQILLFEAGPRILATYPEDLSKQAHRHLERLGVEIHTGSPVERVDKEGITVNGQRVRSRTVVWCAGVLASPAAKWLGVAGDRSGKVKVEPDLSVAGEVDVFVIGDTAELVAETRNLLGFRLREPEPMPGVAQVAIQEGKYVARLIRRRTTGRPAPSSFWYWDKGNLAVVGRTYAIADLRFWRSSGFIAWLLWAGVHIYFLIGFANRIFVSVKWVMSFLTNDRTARIFPSEQTAVEVVNGELFDPAPQNPTGARVTPNLTKGPL